MSLLMRVSFHIALDSPMELRAASLLAASSCRQDSVLD